MSLRKNILVIPQLQAKYFIVSLALICLTACAVYATLWSTLLHEPSIQQLGESGISALTAGFWTNFIWIFVILVLALGLESVFLFHRIAGPVYVLENTMRTASQGDFTAYVGLRKKDELKGLATELQRLIDGVHHAVREDRRTIDEVRSMLIDQGLQQAAEKLSGVTGWFQLDKKQ